MKQEIQNFNCHKTLAITNLSRHSTVTTSTNLSSLTDSPASVFTASVMTGSSSQLITSTRDVFFQIDQRKRYTFQNYDTYQLFLLSSVKKDA